MVALDRLEQPVRVTRRQMAKWSKYIAPVDIGRMDLSDSVKLHWFLPTSGDARSPVEAGQGAGGVPGAQCGGLRTDQAASCRGCASVA
jgi:hypothetical protein